MHFIGADSAGGGDESASAGGTQVDLAAFFGGSTKCAIGECPLEKSQGNQEKAMNKRERRKDLLHCGSIGGQGNDNEEQTSHPN